MLIDIQFKTVAMTMKGKNKFTHKEISELRNLIKERIKADRSRQKSIRAKMRRIGFYGSHDFGITDLQSSDFERLISSGRIKTIGKDYFDNQKLLNEEKIKTSYPVEDQNLTGDFYLYDPRIHTSSHIPDSSGNYIVCLREGSKLPDIGVVYEMGLFQNMEVIYTGIAGKSLRKRDYRQHFTGNNAGRSTLRKSLGSMFGYPKIARDKDPKTGKTKFNEVDEIKLSEWMRSNLFLYFTVNSNPYELEEILINKFNPPLNLSKNSNQINSQFRKKLSLLRTKPIEL